MQFSKSTVPYVFSGQKIVQRKLCGVCSSPFFKDIEEEIRKGTRLIDISKKFKISVKSISNHKNKHLKRLNSLQQKKGGE